MVTLERDLPRDFSRDARRLELSICYHTYHPLSHAFPLIFVPSHSHQFIVASLLTLFIAHQVSLLVVIDSK
jgi:hypothetical protein